jgi:hypothetical protein
VSAGIDVFEVVDAYWVLGPIATRRMNPSSLHQDGQEYLWHYHHDGADSSKKNEN